MLSSIKQFIAAQYFQWNFVYQKKQDKVNRQYSILSDIIKKNIDCPRWEEHRFSEMYSYEDFIRYINTCHYEDIADEITQSMQWYTTLTNEEAIYFARTAWTTTGSSKHIPVTKSSLSKNHFTGGKELISIYMHNNPDNSLLSGKSLILGWWFFINEYTWENNIGYISAILQRESGILGSIFKEPANEISFEHNRDLKIQKILENTIEQNITSLGWLTSRALVLLEKILQHTGKSNMLEVWPNFSLYISWWISFEPYRSVFSTYFPSQTVQFYQAYNASEWFFGVQYNNVSSDMILLTDHGVFYEFIDMESYYNNQQEIHTIETVQKGKHYALVITTYSGLYRYIIGDVISFTDTNMLLFQIVGRTKLYIDVFGEHIIVDNTDKALIYACQQSWVTATEYTLWPLFLTGWQGCHEWIIECDAPPLDIDFFIKSIDYSLQESNSYYAGKRANDIMIHMPIVHFVNKWVFLRRYESKGKVGWQHKIPKLSSNRGIVEELLSFHQTL